MLGISQGCDKPCNQSHNHPEKGKQAIKKQIKCLITNQSTEWTAISQQVKQKFDRLSKHLLSLQKQIFQDIQKQKQKQGLKQIKLSEQQITRINKILQEKYQQVTCRQLAQLVKLARQKPSNCKNIGSKLNTSSKSDKTKNKIKNNQSTQVIMSESYQEIKNNIFQQINERLKVLFNFQQGNQSLFLPSFIGPEQIQQSNHNSSFISNFPEIKQLTQNLNEIKFDQTYGKRQKINQGKGQSVNKKRNIQQKQHQDQGQYKDYIQMKKKKEQSNVQWKLQETQSTIKKKEMQYNSSQQEIINQKIQSQNQFNFQSLTNQQLQKILQQQSRASEAELSNYTYQDQSQFQNKSQINSTYLQQAEPFNLQQYQQKMLNDAKEQSLIQFEQQKINNIQQRENIGQRNQIGQRFIFPEQLQQFQRQNLIERTLIFNHLSAINPIRNQRNRITKIKDIELNKFQLSHRQLKFNMKIKVIKPVQLTIVKGVRFYLKIKFIGADQSGMAIFYTNYNHKIKKGACILLQNCCINLFKNQYEIACKSSLKSQNFFTQNHLTIRTQGLSNNFSRILKNRQGQLSYLVPSSEQIKLSQCVKTLYKRTSTNNQLQRLLRNRHIIRSQRQVIVCILSYDTTSKQYIIGDYTGRVYAKMLDNIIIKIEDTLILTGPVIFIEKDVYGQQKICLLSQKVINLKNIQFSFDKSQIPNRMLNKSNIE